MHPQDLFPGALVAGQLFLFEELLSVIRIVPDSLILDAVHQRSLLAAIDDLCGERDELLRIALEVIETFTVDKDLVDAAPGELRPVLKLGEQVGQLDVGLLENDGCRPGNLGSLHSRLTDGDVGLAPLQPGPGDPLGVP
ncbi:MAG: hypothetical protein OXC65_16310 [Thiotrichales bacterium]|nr:hypothetical protein [Thiotrichales bacterium]